MGDSMFSVRAASGGDRESEVAALSWINFVRRDHHGTLFRSVPKLCDALDGMDEAVRLRDARALRRHGRCMVAEFRADEHAYWPRLRVWWPQAGQICLTYSPALYGISTILYCGQVLFHVSLRVQSRGWRCGVVMSGVRVSGGMFPAFDRILAAPECHWRHVQTQPAQWRAPLWPTISMGYDRPSSEFPT